MDPIESNCGTSAYLTHSIPFIYRNTCMSIENAILYNGFLLNGPDVVAHSTRFRPLSLRRKNTLCVIRSTHVSMAAALGLRRFNPHEVRHDDRES